LRDLRLLTVEVHSAESKRHFFRAS
jgi:hypothetical protein